MPAATATPAPATRRITLDDLFPAMSPKDISPRHIELIKLCHRIGTPFPAEPNFKYSTWWRSLHEIAHWAVKPDWYNRYAVYLFKDLDVESGDLYIPAGTIPGVPKVHLQGLTWYLGGNDVIPEIAMYITDTTPAEMAVRTWSLQVIELMGWENPCINAQDGSFTGDLLFHKPASAKVWSPAMLEHLATLLQMARWNIHVAAGKFRPDDGPDGKSFSLPFPRPARHAEMMANINAVTALCGSGRELTKTQATYWKTFLQARWADEVLAKMAVAAESA